jgi:hypothetical protein
MYSLRVIQYNTFLSTPLVRTLWLESLAGLLMGINYSLFSDALI